MQLLLLLLLELVLWSVYVGLEFLQLLAEVLHYNYHDCDLRLDRFRVCYRRQRRRINVTGLSRRQTHGHIVVLLLSKALRDT